MEKKGDKMEKKGDKMEKKGDKMEKKGDKMARREGRQEVIRSALRTKGRACPCLFLFRNHEKILFLLAVWFAASAHARASHRGTRRGHAPDSRRGRRQHGHAHGRPDVPQVDAAGLGHGVRVFLVLGAYFIACWTRGGQTLPMQTWKIRVIGRNGQPVGVARASLRYVVAWPSIVLLGGGLFWALFDRDHQFLHDRMAGTRITWDPQGRGS